jgi:hypothetical protein
MTRLKPAAASILIALAAACHPTPQPIAEAYAQRPEATRVAYPDPAEGSVDGQVFEY